MLEDNSLVQIGVFDVPLATVEANSNDLFYLTQHFQTLSTTRIGNAAVSGADGYTGNVFDIDTRASQNALGNQLLYVWAFKSTLNTANPQNSRDTATHFALMTLNTSAWRLPTDPDPGAPGSLIMDINQLGATPQVAPAYLIKGIFPTTATGDGGNTHFGLVAIPEPSTGLMLSFGLLALARRRR